MVTLMGGWRLKTGALLAAPLCAFALLFAPPPAFAAPADDIKALLEQGRSAEAYALGKKHPELLGSASFDYYFGIAATDNGHAGEGVLALERYLLNFPDSDIARVELARSNFALGDLSRAREEFEALMRQSPPAGVRATVDRYIEAIRLRESRYQTTSLAWLEAGLGIDSNVNGGVGSANISIPTFGPVTVNGAGVRKGDSFLHVAGGAQIKANGPFIGATGNHLPMAIGSKSGTQTTSQVQLFYCPTCP